MSGHGRSNHLHQKVQPPEARQSRPISKRRRRLRCFDPSPAAARLGFRGSPSRAHTLDPARLAAPVLSQPFAVPVQPR